MRLEDDIDFTTLNWVKPELDEALTRARQALEAYVESPDDASLMQECADELHQVQGTLRMVELYGAATVVQEMEQLIGALNGAEVAEPDDAYAALMRGMMQMPDYLERLQSGYRDIPVVLLPLLNDLRTCRGAEVLHESELFRPDLRSPLPAQAPAAPQPLPRAEQRQEAAALRVRFQQSLLSWFRGQGGNAALNGMRDTLDLLTACCHTLVGRRLWWIAAGVLDGLGQGVLDEHGSEVKQLIGRVDRCIRALIEHGEDALDDGEAVELAYKLLYYVARAKSGSARLNEVRDTYRLQQLLPDAVEVEHARSAMAGHNRELLDTVAQAIKDDLLNVKDALDLYLRNLDGDPAQLAGQADVLDRVGDTLGMLGLNVPRRVVGEQGSIIQDMASRSRPVDEDVLLDVAGALLYVEASLDDHIERLGAHDGEPEDNGPALPRSEARQVLAALMREAVGNIGRVKDMLVAFVESPWDHSRLVDAPACLDEVCGALAMIDAGRSVELVRGIGRFIHNELVVDERIPATAQMDKLADALASIEYYLEAAREHRGGLGHILDVTEQSLDQLGYWPVPARRDAVAEAVPVAGADNVTPFQSPANTADGQDADTSANTDQTVPSAEDTPARDDRALDSDEAAATSAETDDADVDWVEIEEVVEEQVAVPDAMAARAGFQGTSDDIDDEIREVFLEEVQEEIDAVQTGLAAWLEAPDDTQRLTPIRRAFHTLKGSGRLVGAEVLGEFSWKIENMLNRVLDGTIQATDAVQALVGHAVAALPELLRALKGEGTPRAPLLAITAVADRLADGDTEAVLEPTDATETVTRTVRRRVPRDSVVHTPEADVSRPADGETAGEVQTPDEGQTPDADMTSLSMPALPPMDPVLVDILRSEVAQHLATIRAAVSAAAGGDIATDEELLRAVHTLHGAIAMVDIPMLEALLAPLEGWLKRLRALGQAVPATQGGVLAEAADVIEQVAAQFNAAQPHLPDAAALTSRIAQWRDALPVPQKSYPLYGDDALQAHDGAADAEDHEPSVAPTDEADEAAWHGLDAVDMGELVSDDTAEAHADDDQESYDWSRLTRFAAFGDAYGDGDDRAATTPEAEQPEAEQPEAEQPEAEQPEAEQPEAEQPEAEQPEAEQPEVEQSEAEQPEAEQVDVEPTDAVSAVAAVELGPLSDDYHFPTQAQPEGALDVADLDAELLDIFVEEAHDILDHADGSMAALRAQPHSDEPLHAMQRDLHTLKGGARMASLMAIGDLAHVMESLLEALGADVVALDADIVESLEHGFDYLHDMVQRAGRRQALRRPDQVIAHFEALAQDTGVSEPQDTAAPEAAVADPQVPRPELLPEEAPAQRAPQEMIRVRSDLIDSLVNAAGEVSIYRARLEQQVSGFRFNLVEFDQTVTRLRDQLRKLEIETEAQIIARYQREHEDHGSFDPLELDRFSQLQQYSRALAESVADLVSLQGMLDDNTRRSETLLLQQSRVSSELQEGLMRTRMVPFDAVVPTLRRTLRQAGQETGKRAHLKVSGAHGEMDRNLLERLKAPFEHMLRNALAHGIEDPAERRKAGKPEDGTVSIDVSRDATEVVIRVSDDGAGMDRDAIRAKAISRGLLREGVELGDSDLFAFVLESGFSTADHVTQLAGRGVGMDVVANEIKQIGGTLRIESERGKGTTFLLRVPFTLAVTQAVLVKVGDATFAVPMTSVQGVARIKPGETGSDEALLGGNFVYAGEEYTIHDMAGLLDIPAGHLAENQQQPLLLARSGDMRAAVRVDAILGSREIVVKPVGPQVSSVQGIFGATIMGDGSVLLILDLAPLVRQGLARAEYRQAVDAAEGAVAAGKATRGDERSTVMVVDDSITMRKVAGRILERYEYDVVTAKDGMDALEKLQERVPDVMLLDIEMPRMDGYELATHMKNDSRLARVPIIMITSRSGEKHRQRAFDIGVDRYIGKPYQEADLVAQIGELLGADA